MKHLTRDEYDIAKEKLVDEVVNLTIDQKTKAIPVSDINIDADDDPFFGSSMFDSPSRKKSAHGTVTDSTEADNKALHRSAVLREVENYLDPEIYVHPKQCPLAWWKEHRFRFPWIAVAARKWLSVPASSTPSERVFSHCGVALTAKRASMRGDALMNQVLLKNNLKHVNLDLSDIKKALLT
jgi:hypothetical protein